MDRSRMGRLAVLCVVLLGCPRGDPVVPMPHATTIRSITITPRSGTVGVGGSSRLRATALDDSGESVATTFTWKSSASDVASVTSDGMVSTLRVGSATITAASAGLSSSASFTVAASGVPASTIVLSTTRDSLHIGDSRQLVATARDLFDTPIRDRSPLWSTTQAAVATVSSGGMVTAKAAGAATIVAEMDGARDQATVVVLPPSAASIQVSPPSVTLGIGQTQMMSATARDASGNTIAGRSFTWRSANAAIASVGADGMLRAIAAGATTVFAGVDGREGNAAVIVVSSTARTVVVAPTSASINVNATVQLTASARDAAGAVVSRPVTWTSGSASIARVSPTGVVTGVAAGTATILAVVDGIQAAAVITVKSASFGQPGCAADAIPLSGSSGIQLLNSFGSTAEDNVFQQEVSIQRSFYSGVPASVVILNEGGFQSRNAYARPDGYILFGYYMYHYVIGGYGGLAVAGVLAHEWGHRTQYTFGWSYSTPIMELEADAFSGYYMALAKGWAWSQIQGYFANVYATGDYFFNNPQHHGTPNQRLAAAYLGVNVAITANANRRPFSYAELNSIFAQTIAQQILPYPAADSIPAIDAQLVARLAPLQATLRALPLRDIVEGKSRGVDARVDATSAERRALWPRL